MLTIAELAARLGGTVGGCDGSAEIHGVAPVDRAGSEEAAVVFGGVSGDAGDAGVLVVRRDVGEIPGRATIAVDEPRVALAQLTRIFAPPLSPGTGIHPSAIIAANSAIDPAAWVGPLCVVEEGVTIGAGAVLVAQVYAGRGVTIESGAHILPHVTLYSGTRVGLRVTIQAGARIGCDGFGYVTEATNHPKVHSLAGVRLGDDVEIGANTTIERGTFDDTVVGRGTKIGDGCHIGHNVTIGEYGLFAGQIVIGGSAQIGDRVHVAMGVVVRDHALIGDRCTVMMGSHVVGDLAAGSRVLGSPAAPEEVHKARVRALDAALGRRP